MQGARYPMMVLIVCSLGLTTMAGKKNVVTTNSEIAGTGNLSKIHREELVAKIGKIKEFLQQSPDTNAVQLLSFAADLEKEVRNKKFGLVFEEHKERVDVELEENLPVLTENKLRLIDNGGEVNFLIEGDNLAALKLLEKTHRGKIDLIYIDPPYNTGKKDFVYNDNYVDTKDAFRHSKWLSFMRERLLIARKLLSDSGIILVSIDDNEQAALRLLMDDAFGDNFIALLPTIMNLKGNQDQLGFAGTHEYTLVFAKDRNKVVINQFNIEDDDSWSQDEIGYYKKGATLKRTGEDAPRESRHNGYFPILIDKTTHQVSTISKDEYEAIYDSATRTFDDQYVEMLRTKYQDDGYVFILPMIDDVKASWRWSFNKVRSEASEIIVSGAGDNLSLYKKQRPTLGELPSAKPKTLFYKATYSSGNGTAQLKNILGSKVFDNPKPLELIADFVQIGSRKDSVILDFFAGSGTTGHAVMKLNAEDGGKRKFILVTNNENEICEKVTYERLKRVIEKENYAAKLKYYKIDYVPIKEQMYYEYADDLLAHIRELVELENGVDFTHDGEIAIVLTDDEIEKLSKNASKLKKIKTLYRGHNVLMSNAVEEKLKSQNIEIRVIPQYYYPELEG